MLDGNVLLRQKRDEVPKGTLSCPDRIMEFFYQLRHYEGSHLLLSVCGWKLIQQTLLSNESKSAFSSSMFIVGGGGTVILSMRCTNQNGLLSLPRQLEIAILLLSFSSSGLIDLFIVTEVFLPFSKK